jgi:hypothetical protein
VTKGMWRILDGKVGEMSIVFFAGTKLVANACVN